MIIFSRSERLRMLIRRRMVGSEERMGTPNGPFDIRYVLENAQNGKGYLLAGVGMDLGSAPRSLGVGAILLSAVDEANCGARDTLRAARMGAAR
jgi:hypothetical protein